MTAPAKTLKTAADLAEAGLIGRGDIPSLDPVAARYAIAVTPAMAALIDPFDPADPIGRQFIPDPAEIITSPEERADPIGDDAFSPVEGIVHRYPDRVLLKLTQLCPVYCRFCFRRETVGPGGDAMLSAAALERAMGFIAAHPAIWEVILTGGDPLVLAPRRLAEVAEQLAGIAHVKVLRVHSRVPVVDPERITAGLIAALMSARKTLYLGLHVNHARELTAAARAAIGRLLEAGIPVLSQTVLLKGVNDDAETLAALMRALVEARVKPYYLHHPDLAPGTARFRLTIEEGQALVRALRGRLSGLCQPQYVIDIPGGHGKSPIGPGYLSPLPSETVAQSYVIEDYQGGRHRYPPAGEDR